MDRAGIEDLIARVSLGDREAFSRLYEATSAKLMGVTLRVLKDRAPAEDALHDTYVKVWRSAGSYVSNGYSPMTWLITIARNTAIDRLRATRSTDGIENYAETLAAGGPGPEGCVIAKSDAEQLIACLDELPQARGDAIRSVYLEGISYAECAERLGIPLNTVRTWLRRGLASLRECMGR